VDKSYIAVYWDALRRGPESPEQLAEALASRKKPAAPVGAAGIQAG
jgi:hypothetical protein